MASFNSAEKKQKRTNKKQQRTQNVNKRDGVSPASCAPLWSDIFSPHPSAQSSWRFAPAARGASHAARQKNKRRRLRPSWKGTGLGLWVSLHHGHVYNCMYIYIISAALAGLEVRSWFPIYPREKAKKKTGVQFAQPISQTT